MNRTGTPTPTHSQPGRSRWLPAGAALAAAVSAITGVISYSHGLAVARWTGNAGLVAYLLPLVPDLMIGMASLTLIEASSARQSRPPTAIAALVAGIGWTVVQNVAAGVRDGAGGAVLDAGVPLALVVTFESLLWLLRHGRAPAAATAASHGEPPAPPSAEEALAALLASESQRRLAELLDVPRSRVQAWARLVATPVPEPSLNGSAAGA